jgi:hypothetical protein
MSRVIAIGIGKADCAAKISRASHKQQKIEEFNIERDEREMLMEFVGQNVSKAFEIARK